jgi:hypothetical protein
MFSQVKVSFESKSPDNDQTFWNIDQDSDKEDPISRFLADSEEPSRDELYSPAYLPPELLEDENDIIDPLDHGIYTKFILQTSAYQWLKASLQREATMTRPVPDLMDDIRQTIMTVLPSPCKPDRKSPSQGYTAEFEVNWNPTLFIDKQEYTQSASKAIERAITLTGTLDDAQAMTTREYLSKLWLDTGSQLMQLVIDVIQNHHAHCKSIVPLSVVSPPSKSTMFSETF